MSSSQPTVDKISCDTETEPSVGCDEGMGDRLNEAPRYDAKAMARNFYEFQADSVKKECPPVTRAALYVAFEAGWKRCLRAGLQS